MIARRLASSLACAAIAFAALPSSASAQTFGYDDRRLNESRQDFAVEIRVGPWLPDVDAEFGGAATPFRDIFGTAPRLLFGAEFDWQILRIGPVMSLGVGAGLSYTNVSANAPFTTSTLNPNAMEWGARSSESTSISALPGLLLAVARFDGLARHVPWFPIVPYVKFGLNYTLWWVSNGRGLACDPCTPTESRRDVIGGSLGLHLAGGLALSLEVFEPHVQRQWDAISGVNHSYAFFEVSTEMMGGLGRTQLNMGTTTWAAGIALEF